MKRLTNWEWLNLPRRFRVDLARGQWRAIRDAVRRHGNVEANAALDKLEAQLTDQPTDGGGERG